MKFIPLGTVLEDVQQDYETAQKVDRWRVGQKAFYAPGGFRAVSYLPLSEICSAYPHSFLVKGGNSCCSTISTGGAVITYGDRQVLKILPGSGKQGTRLLELLKERIPGLDMEVPEIYRSGAGKLI